MIITKVILMACMRLFGIAYTIIDLSGIVLWLGGIGIHLWTTIIAFVYGGFISAFITFMLPVIGEVFWTWKSLCVLRLLLEQLHIYFGSYLAVWGLALSSLLILH